MKCVLLGKSNKVVLQHHYQEMRRSDIAPIDMKQNKAYRQNKVAE